MKSLDIPAQGTKIDYITIRFTGGHAIGRLNRSSIHTATVPYVSFAHKLGAIHRAGGKVISISTPYAHSVQSEVVLPEVSEVAKIAAAIAATPSVETNHQKSTPEPISKGKITDKTSKAKKPKVAEVVAEVEAVESVTVATEATSKVEVNAVVASPEVTVAEVSEPVVEPTVEVATEVTIAEPIAVAEKVSEVIAETGEIDEPVVELIAEPVVEPEADAKPKKSRASSKSGGFNKPKVDTAPAKATRSPRKPKS